MALAGGHLGPPGAQGPSCRILRGPCVIAGAGYGAGPCWCGAHDPHPITAEAYEAIAATLRSAVSPSSATDRDKRTLDVN